MAGALHPGIAHFTDSAITVAADSIRPWLPNTAVAAFTVGYAALVAGAVFAAAQAVRYILVVLPTTGAWIAVVVPYSLYAFWHPGRRGTPFWLWLVYVGISLPIMPWGSAAAALVPAYLDSSVARRHLPVYGAVILLVLAVQYFKMI